jgi:hypothetical protein
MNSKVQPRQSLQYSGAAGFVSLQFALAHKTGKYSRLERERRAAPVSIIDPAKKLLEQHAQRGEAKRHCSPFGKI